MCVESCEALPRPMASHNSQKGVFFAKRAPLPCLVARLSTWRGVTWCGGGPWTCTSPSSPSSHTLGT